MKSFLQALPLLLVGAVAMHSACADNGEGDDTSAVTVTTEPYVGAACNGGRPDGYCNSLGDNPESCECFDCVDTAYCNGTCVDDGTCGADEDCTCDDCFDPGCDGGNQNTMDNPNSMDNMGGFPPEGGREPKGGGPGAGGSPPDGGGGSGGGGAPSNGGAGGA
jgi:hypothetical protein